jgi:type VI secretion system secreted protein Hcp
MAYEFYVSVEGTKSGKFKGESPRAQQKEKIPGISFEYEVKAPFDAASGQHSGKRHHSPITFVKEWGAATPQFFNALVTNETLKTVAFEFSKPDTTGKEGVYYKITLTNATVVSIRQFSSDAKAQGSSTAKHTYAGATNELEAISFTFDKILVENTVAKTSAMDDWKEPQT